MGDPLTKINEIVSEFGDFITDLSEQSKAREADRVGQTSHLRQTLTGAEKEIVAAMRAIMALIEATEKLNNTANDPGWRWQMFSKSDFRDLKVIVIGVCITIAIFLTVVAFVLGRLW